MQALAEAADAMGLSLQGLFNSRAGGEYRGTGQNMATGANKLSFTTAIRAASGISWNGSTTFTVTTAGVYCVYCGPGRPFISTSNWAVAVNDASGWPSPTYT